MSRNKIQPRLITVFIQAKLANPFQENSFIEAVKCSVAGVCQFYRITHKRNDIIYKVNAEAVNLSKISYEET